MYALDTAKYVCMCKSTRQWLNAITLHYDNNKNAKNNEQVIDACKKIPTDK